MKQNKAMERIWWIRKFGKPIYECRFFKIVYIGSHLKMFINKSKKWHYLEEDKYGFYYNIEKEYTETCKVYIKKEYSEELKEIIIERELLS